MRMESYLCKSRHGIFYFRWPVKDVGLQRHRATLRISLGTRCPKQAGELSRYLASCGTTLTRSGVLMQMRYDELRERVHAYFKSQLATYKDRIAAGGPLTEKALVPLGGSRTLAEGPSDTFWDIVAPEGEKAFLGRFCESSGFPEAEASANPVRLLEEIKIAYRDMLRALADHQAQLGSYDYAEKPAVPQAALEPVTPQYNGIPLSQCITEYMEENRKANSWSPVTVVKKSATLDVLQEILGNDRPMDSLTKQDAQEVKRLILELPTNRNKLPQTKDLDIRSAIAVPGMAKITVVTVNGYISIFQSFFDWAMKNGHVASNLFAGMRVGKSSNNAAPKRSAYTAEALRAVYTEMRENRLGLIKTESHKWATLIGIFTGARLNEICQLQVGDIQREGDIWYFNLTDEGEGNKRFKTSASIRRVPIHTELLSLGLLDYRERMSAGRSGRLFPDFSYSPKSGYGRNLGQWFNDTLIPTMGLKTKSHVFHGFRHTMVTRLAQAGVQEPVYQSIVGHERRGTTQGYNQGYTLQQLKEAIDLFKP